MVVTALDLGLRGAAAGLFLMMLAVVLLRVRPIDTVKLLGAAMAASGAAYAIATAPLVPKAASWWMLAILVANPVIFWLWARATFDDEFVVRRWHGALWLVIVGIGFTVFLTWTTWPTLARASARLLSVTALVLSLAAAVQTVRTWSADLVAGRRRLRIAVLILSLLLIGLITGSDLTSFSAASLGISGSLASAVALAILASLAGWNLFYPPPASPAIVAAATNSAAAAGVAQFGPPADGGSDPIAPLVLQRLEHVMTVERVYRKEGLTIGMLAARLNLPEYRLREVINEGLGYRNFNAFLNRHRIDEARAALSDPGQRDVPVLTIAMDAGFQSIGPFNRAFKAATGMTPTDFRRDALARSQGSESARNLKIG
jgi:AraC-like DNA-binding protein